MGKQEYCYTPTTLWNAIMKMKKPVILRIFKDCHYADSYVLIRSD